MIVETALASSFDNDMSKNYIATIAPKLKLAESYPLESLILLYTENVRFVLTIESIKVEYRCTAAEP